jgi:hypothetical protein
VRIIDGSGPSKVNEFVPWSKVTDVQMLQKVGGRKLVLQVVARQIALPVAYGDAPRMLRAIEAHMV